MKVGAGKPHHGADYRNFGRVSGDLRIQNAAAQGGLAVAVWLFAAAQRNRLTGVARRIQHPQTQAGRVATGNGEGKTAVRRGAGGDGLPTVGMAEFDHSAGLDAARRAADLDLAVAVGRADGDLPGIGRGRGQVVAHHGEFQRAEVIGGIACFKPEPVPAWFQRQGGLKPKCVVKRLRHAVESQRRGFADSAGQFDLRGGGVEAVGG